MERKLKYSLIHSVSEAHIKEIRRKIRLSMNGIVSEQMTLSGVKYKQNFGVSIPRIKEIAKDYLPDHNLAEELWKLRIRETMILATLLEPVDSFTSDNAWEWVTQFNQIEIIEQAVMNLFCKLSYADRLCTDWIKSDVLWIQITGFILLSRIVEKLDSHQTTLIVRRALNLSTTDNLHLCKAIALGLSRMCRKDKETAASIIKELESISQTPLNSQIYIYHEVKQEILFLNIL